jgi:hypothetical protein
MTALTPTDAAGWCFDIKSAPHGRYVVQQRRAGVDMRVFVPERVILATKCGKVTISHYLPDEKRWMMLHYGEQPVAWKPWPVHPNSKAPDRNGANVGGDDVTGSAAARTEASEDVVALTGQIESPVKAEIIGYGNASLAARESEKPLHSNPPETAHEAGRFNSGSLTEIVVKTQVQVLPGVAFGDAKGGSTGMERSDSQERLAPNPPFAAPAVPHTTTPSSESPEGEAQSLSGEPIESDSPKSRPGDAAASLTQQSNSPRQERPSAQERSSDRSGGQFGDAPKPVTNSSEAA